MPHKPKSKSKNNEVKAYKRRNEAVNKREIEELRTTPLELKYRQFWTLFRWAIDMDWQINTPKEIAQVRRRWARLRKAHGA